MSARFIANRQWILKASRVKTRQRTTRTYTRLESLSKQMAGAVKVDFLHGIQTFKKRVPLEDLLHAFLHRNYDRLHRLIPWGALPDDLEETIGGIKKTADQSSMFSSKALPSPVQKKLRWDTQNPRLTRFLDTRTAELVTRVSESQRDVIRAAVRRSFDRAWTPRQVADEVKGSIGLNLPQFNALQNYRARLEDEGVHAPEHIESLVQDYGARLLDQRAMNIARTETRMATNYGQLEVWKEASSQGLIDPATSQKVWIVDGNPCEICEPMDGVAVGLDEAWELNTGDFVTVPTESHPNCYCGMEIRYGEGEDVSDQDSD